MSTPPVWRRREPPLPVAAVVATGPVATRLAAVTAERVIAGAWLRACGAEGWFVVLGDAADLPWVDGVRYLGWESGVLVPTTETPTPGPVYVRTAVAASAGELVVLLPDAVLVSPVPQRRADPARLR